jgi:hypothetical protein
VIDEDDDMLSAMARELVESNGIGDTVDSVWRALSTEHQKLFPTSAHRDDDAASIEATGILLDTQPDLASLVEVAMDTAPIVVFGQRPQSLSGKRRRGRLSRNRRHYSASVELKQAKVNCPLDDRHWLSEVPFPKIAPTAPASRPVFAAACFAHHSRTLL